MDLAIGSSLVRPAICELRLPSLRALLNRAPHVLVSETGWLVAMRACVVTFGNVVWVPNNKHGHVRSRRK